MSRWTIEKSGTGIENSGTVIEKSGTGIEKSGTGIEKSGTGIEKSGTGIRKGLLACSLAALALTTHVSAAEFRPEGFMQVAVDQGQVSVMWNIDGNTFVGKGSQVGTFTQVSLFEISLNNNPSNIEIAGGGTGLQIAGGGTGYDSIVITLPSGLGLELELSLGCNSATVSVLDSTNLSEVVTFNNVPVMGDTGLCESNARQPVRGFGKTRRSNRSYE
jgi:hypothetical protein